MNAKMGFLVAAALCAAGISSVASAQSTFTEDFTGQTTNNSWYFFNGACLTAGSTTNASSPGQVPSCISIAKSYYAAAEDKDAALVGGANGVSGTAQTLPDPVGSGALRFTNGYPYGNGENGAIVSSTAFNAGQGIQITFKAVTYRGDSGGTGKDGADGMSFYLMDGSVSPSGTTWNGIGSWGGSLGYTCSNSNAPYDGLIAAYLGLGIDEFGNFLNGTSLVSGYTGPNVATGDNTALGYGFFPGRIGLRGAGNVSWNYLHTTYPNYYRTTTLNTTALQQAAVQKTCSTGEVWNYANSATNPTVVNNPTPALQDYAPIAGQSYYQLPSTVQLANESAMARPTGIMTNGVTNGNVFLYNLQITQNGLLSFSFSVNGGAYTNLISGQSISASNGALPATLRFGFAGSTGGDTNIHEILCFKAAPSTVSSSSATVNEKQTSQVQTTSQAYFAFYNPNDWTGRVTAYALIDNAGSLSIGSYANWDSECVLTGVPAGQACLYSGTVGPSSAEPPASRIMLTWNGLDTAAYPGTAGIPFEWGNLTSTEQGMLDAGDATPITANRLNYLRGVRTHEIDSLGVGLFRARDGVLADIVDASPTWVGPPASPYTQTWEDRLYGSGLKMPENSGQQYSAFQTAEQSRLNVIYAGANDGFLHGFRTGSEDANGDVISSGSTLNDGYEVMAYMPGAVLNTIHNSTNPSLDYPNAQYAHAFYVDATPGTGDLYYNSAWHTWLVGGLGLGGSAIYALDITNPSNPSSTSETAQAALVKGEWSSATISCVGNTTCGSSLGNTYGTPQIRRFHNGSWGAVFGNGYGSANGDPGIFVMLVNSSGVITFYYLSACTPLTGTANVCNQGSNGIAYVSPADLDGDHITDYVYAGDLAGNVWRFDLTSQTPSNWTVSAGPLFKTPSGQPITTPLVLASAVVTGTSPQLIVAFGTGQRTQFTTTSATTYVSGTQALYGVWDWNLSTWNAAASAAKYASLTTVQAASITKLNAPYTLSLSNLTQQVFTSGTSGIDSSNNPVNYVQCTGTSGTGCTGGFGWYANLIGTNGTTNGSGAQIIEQIVSGPALYEDAFLVNSTIPANNQPLNCNSPTTDTGVTYALAVVSGGTFAAGGASPTPSTTTFASAFVNYRDTSLVGLATNETGSLSVVNTKEGTTYIVGQDIAIGQGGTAPGQVQQIQLANTAVNRLTWVELR